MITLLQAPAWADNQVPSCPTATLRQLVNATGPLASGMAVVLDVVQRAQLAEDGGEVPVVDAGQRNQLIAMCAVAAQVLMEVASDASNDLAQLSVS